MRGAIHGIWLVAPGGKLHKAIIPTLSAWVPAAAAADFHVMLWTNIDELKYEEIIRLKDAKINIGDPRKLKESPLYKHYEYFLNKGIKGDTTAFALASDILRMAILDFTANDKYFIYVDPNDINFLDLSANLHKLDAHMAKNKLGYSFPVGRVASKTDVFDMRNDVLIARKANNPNFFKDYLTAYWTNLEETYQRYEKPTSDGQAKFFANRISNGTSILFFRLEPSNHKSVKVVAQFADYSEVDQVVNSSVYLNYTRIIQQGNNWVPVGSKFAVREELAMNSTFVESLIAEQNQYANAKATDVAIASKKNTHEGKIVTATSYTIIFGGLLMLILIYIIFRGKFTSKAN